MKTKSTLIILFFLCTSSWAQNYIKGKVTDKKTGEPLPFVNIFVNNSQIGTVSDKNGNYQLQVNISSTIEVFASFIGYKTAQKIVSTGKNNVINFELTPTELLLEEKVITAKKDKAWEKRLNQFEKYFFGKGDYASQCKIINPWVLDIQKKQGKLIASSNDQLLKIENQALGYQVNYLLENFSHDAEFTNFKGLVAFTPLKPKNENEANKWKNNRSRAYYGSLRHFFKSVIDGKVEENGYEAYYTKVNNDGGSEEEERIDVDKKNLFIFNQVNFKDFIRILYFSELAKGKAQETWIELRNPTSIYSNGEPKDPYAVVFHGHMGDEVLPYMLPMEYQEEAGNEKVIRFYQSIISPFKHYHSMYTPEKIHIHTDKSLYWPRETIWMKGYVNLLNQPSKLSTKLFVQLEKEDSVYTRTVVKVENGSAVGRLDLPDSIATGTYLLTAYSDWLDTISQNFHFSKKLMIGLPENPASARGNSAKNYQIRLFPEGGNIISGLENSFAYEIRDENGILANVPVTITANDQVVLQDTTTWQGKGKSTLKFNSNKQYAIQVDLDPSSKKPITVLQQNSISLSSKYLQEGIEVTINKPKKDNSLYHYALVSNDQIIDYRSFEMSKKYVISIPNEVLQEGVNQLSIFDEQFLPIAERLYFKKPDMKGLRPGFSFQTRNYDPRSAIALNFSDTEKIRDASLAVVDMSQTFESGEENILISHYLRPWIQGSISGNENLITKSSDDQLDLLMMTQGWSRYNWQDQQTHKNDTITELAISQGLDITGKVFYEENKKPVANTVILLSSAETGLLTTTSDETGKFTFKNVFYTDSSSLIFKAQSVNTKRKIVFSFDELNWQPHEIPAFAVNSEIKMDLNELKENQRIKTQLAEVYNFDGKTYYLKDAIIKGERSKPVNLDESPFTSEFSDKILLDSLNLASTPNTFDVLTRKFPRLVARVEQNIETQEIRPVIRLFGRIPLILIDNLPAQPADVQTLNVENIYSIEVLRAPVSNILGTEGGSSGGIFIITKKQPSAKKKKRESDFVLNKLKGFQKYKEFYSPDHSVQSEGYVPDRRSTLYWNPGINSETNEVVYYNHDNPALIKIILEGYTTAGKPFRQTAFYNIER